MNKLSYVYIVTNFTNTTLYVGVCNNLVNRIFQHKNGFGSQFTKKYKLTKLVYYEVSEEMLEAIKREKQIKNLVRRKKIDLINKMNPSWEDLYLKLCN